MLTLGCTAQDKITGFRGIVTGLVDYISGCNQALLVPKVDAGGNHKEAHWFDVQRLEVIDAEGLIKLDNGATPGCDKQAPVR